MRRLKVLIPAIALVTVFAMAPTANSAVVVKGVWGASGFHWMPKTNDLAPGTKVTWKAVTELAHRDGLQRCASFGEHDDQPRTIDLVDFQQPRRL